MDLMKKIVLASQSPRRRELMQYLNVHFETVSPNIEEHMDMNLPIQERIESIAKQKARSVFEKRPDNLVIGCDTVVVFESEVLGKPITEENAIEMLKRLSGKTHVVYTSVAMISSKQKVSFTSKTEVTFYDLDDKEIEDYVKTKEPLDKAGAYTIQGGGAIFVKEITGDFYTVMGLPIAKMYQTIKQYEW